MSSFPGKNRNFAKIGLLRPNLFISLHFRSLDFYIDRQTEDERMNQLGFFAAGKPASLSLENSRVILAN